ncbi:NRDE protein-domain-containing protein [Xylariaceae sp. FL1272]|nr:NRDE protein-domain-containing protein [Xylariaceae sp. FL1272]
MCIALVTTAHPKYALIAIDNRDEYLLRPTSRPHWWTHEPSGARILSPRDLHRQERGTWMGVTSAGRFAILTNYRESPQDDPDKNIEGLRSRGVLPTAWFSAPADESLDGFVQRMLDDPKTRAVGGFSLICGDLKPRVDTGIQPLAIISNRCDKFAEVPRIGAQRGATYALSNTIYIEPSSWPKVQNGKRLLEEALRDIGENDLSETELMDRLLTVLDNDTMPVGPDASMLDHMNALRHSVFIPAFADDQGWRDMADARDQGRGQPPFDEADDSSEPKSPPRTDPTTNFLKGAYGTQRQTVVLVDWDGNVTYMERALWDMHGNRLENGKGDQVVKFRIDS